MLPERVTSPPISLRLFTPDDAPRVQLLAGDHAVAETTALIPHPYRSGMAEEWIATHEAARERGIAYVYAITRAEMRSWSARSKPGRSPTHTKISATGSARPTADKVLRPRRQGR